MRARRPFGPENVTTFDDDSPNGNAQWSFGDSNISVSDIAEDGDDITLTIAGVDRGKALHIKHASGGAVLGVERVIFRLEHCLPTPVMFIPA